MFLHRIHVDPRCREAQRDLADPYQLHATLCRAFSTPDKKCLAGEFLWRHEPESGPEGYASILVQSLKPPDWKAIGVKGWLAKADPAIDLMDRLGLISLKIGQQFRFRLRANPCVMRDRKRQGLLRLEDQEGWIERKGRQHGFSLQGLASFYSPDKSQKRIDVRVSQERMLRGTKHPGTTIRIFSVLYDGILTVADQSSFIDAIQKGVGHGKVLGLGLLSIAPIS
jgi:CRISPR system Cascade subunit CasE